MYKVKEIQRCGWCLKDDLYIRYHDEEWGVPVYDDQTMFEYLILETFQAGLSWYTVLKKRENFRNAFFGFNPEKMASIDEAGIEILMHNTGIIRNGAKIRAAVRNAQAFIELSSETGFSDYLWSFTDGKTIQTHMRSMNDLRSTSPESDNMSRELKKRGFGFVGSTVCYAHMQATGIINDHLTDCFRYKELAG